MSTAAVALLALLGGSPLLPAPEDPRAAVAQVIDDSIGWFRTKDFGRLFAVHAEGPELFLFQPSAKDTIQGGTAFRAFADVWRDPDVLYESHAVRNLHIHISASGQHAWFSALLDDCARVKGKVSCWKDARWTGVLEKRAHGWVMVQGHFSFVPSSDVTALLTRYAGPGDVTAAPARTVEAGPPEILRAIEATFGWAVEKDWDLFRSTRLQDERLFVFPSFSAEPVQGFEQLGRKAQATWLQGDFRALGHSIRDLRLHVAPRDDLAWFSAVVDDWNLAGGQPAGWKDVRWTGVLVKEQGRWQIAQNHFSVPVEAVRAARAILESGAPRGPAPKQ
jgi:ketosteroid isomerase-like protein